MTILAVHPSVALPKADRDRLRRAGVVVISADPSKVQAVEVQPLLPMETMLRAALATVNEKRSYSNGQEIRSDFAHRLITALLTPDDAEPAP